MILQACALVFVTSTIFMQGTLGATYTGTPPANVSAPLGVNVSFYCEITGAQTQGQVNNFRKVSPETLFIAADATPTNTTKHAIDLLYRLTVLDLALTDEGLYQCDMFPEQFQFYLQVTDPPVTMLLFWPGGESHTFPGEAVNLTCEAGMAHPTASFRWFRGLTDISADAYTPSVPTDAQGYGKGVSVQTFTFSEQDENTAIRCVVDMPDQTDVLAQNLIVKFSGGAPLRVSGALFLSAVFTLLTRT